MVDLQKDGACPRKLVPASIEDGSEGYSDAERGWWFYIAGSSDESETDAYVRERHPFFI